MEITADFLESALQALKEEIFASLHVAMPGIVQAYDAEKRTAVVQPAIMRKNADGRIITAPVLLDVPVFLCGAEREVAAGEACLLIFCDFCIDGWFETGQPTLPASTRSHDLSDAFALIQ